MKISKVIDLGLNGPKVIKAARFSDERGYFMETYRYDQVFEAIGATQIHQVNESYSKKNVVRGLHFQWEPYMGKIVRVISGRMFDLALDVRKGSPSFGQVVSYDLNGYGEEVTWVWVPAGFAHGCVFVENTVIEYLCTGSYSPATEASISPLAQDINWGKCENEKEIRNIISTANMTEKDRNGFTLEDWLKNENSDYFTVGK